MKFRTHTVDEIMRGKHPVSLIGHGIQQPQVSAASVKPWSKPPAGWVSVTIDGSFRDTDQAAGLGIVLRDEYGLTISTSCHFLQDCESPLEAETRACAEGRKLALVRSQLPFRVETDCTQLITMLVSTAVDRSPLLHLVLNIKLVFSGIWECTFVKGGAYSG